MTKSKFLRRIKKNWKCRPFLQHKEVCCISAKARKLCRNGVQLLLLLLIVVIVVLWIGAEVEDHRTKNENDTTYLYETSHVCGIELPDAFLNDNTIAVEGGNYSHVTGRSDGDNVSSLNQTSDDKIEPLVIRTFDSVEEINIQQEDNNNTKSTIKAHCGDCGSCSNPHDIQIYDETKETLFESSYECSKRGIFGGRRAARRCLQESVGFSDECNECWVENIMCDLKLCIFTCMWHAIFSEVNGSGDEKQPLNRCTECDEKRCGPAFVKCAGANRRRSGILSEFDRDIDQEVCESVDKDWWKDEELQSYWDLQLQSQEEEDEDNDEKETTVLEQTQATGALDQRSTHHHLRSF